MASQVPDVDRVWSCAYCLKSVAAAQLMFCGGCRRRSYCSRQCQKYDWKMDGKGQGHKVWCSQLVGEEDIHWKVQHISDEKGMGLVALQDLPMGFKIIVERAITPDRIDEFKEHIMQLAPRNATLDEKWQLNAMRRSPTTTEGVLNLRMSRANHSCDENAEHTLATFNSKAEEVHILNALRGIRKGEEITISYTVWTDSSQDLPAFIHRFILSQKWNIYCSPFCRCYDPQANAVVGKARLLEHEYKQYMSNRDAQGALKVAKELISLHERHNSSFITLMRNVDDALRAAVLCKDLQPQAQEFARRRYEFEVMIGGEECDDAKYAKQFVDDPESHPSWGKFDTS